MTTDVAGATNGADITDVVVDAEVAVDAYAVEVEVAEPAKVDDHCERSETSDLRETAEEASIWESERRRGARVPYDRRIVALDEEAARVLVGRDLSRGGMRIATNPSVRIGDVLRIALHSGSQSNPVMVIAKASRDDGNGMILTFDDLSPAQLDQLEKIIGSDHSVHAKAEDFETLGVSTDGIVIAEMIETVSPTSDSRNEADLD